MLGKPVLTLHREVLELELLAPRRLALEPSPRNHVSNWGKLRRLRRATGPRRAAMCYDARLPYEALIATLRTDYPESPLLLDVLQNLSSCYVKLGWVDSALDTAREIWKLKIRRSLLEDLVQLDPIRSGLFDAREEEKGEMDQSQAIVGTLVRARNEQLDWCIHDLTPETFRAYS